MFTLPFLKILFYGNIPKSSTLFGGLCWAIREFQGESHLNEFLDSVEKDQALIMGDLHPQGFHLIPLNPLQPNDKTLKNQKKEMEKIPILQRGHKSHRSESYRSMDTNR